MPGPMTCPHCDVPLVTSERQGIEIDYCPTCRGIWLDRGELDKILERASADMAPQAPYPPQGGYDPATTSGHDPRYPHHKRKKSWLEEIFD